MRLSFIPYFKMKQEKELETMLIITLGFLFLFFIFEIPVFLFIAFGVSLLGSTSRSATQIITKGWLKIAEILGWINSKVILIIIFYLFLCPLSFLMRLSKRNTLKMKKEKTTYYTERGHIYKPEDLKNTW